MNDASLATYMTASKRYFLMPGYVFVSQAPAAIQTVLGSCVGVCLYDRKKKYGGMNHYLLPAPRGEPSTARYGGPAMTALFRAFIDFGSDPGDLEAQIFGGAGMPGNSQSSAIGAENVFAARKFLARHGIPVLSEDVAGNLGRKLIFLSSLNRALVYKLDSIRRADFFDYSDSRRELHGGTD
jgi:chemotaxis protein CheD